ncbi:hypothetical protein ABZT34_41910 [Streptomyces sp. NPDC005329]|uniref:hypothetical protein n=1 Tax=Streptomyces sp. NPDC005329 TaxID=3157034 RepID=UPI0033A491FD
MVGEKAFGKVAIGNARAWLIGRTPVFWLTLSALSCVGLFLTWFWGAWSGGLDVAETCALLRGQKYDDAYRAEHWREPSRFFPLHNKCNASYDLVPAWVNPTLVLLALLAVGSLITGVSLLIVAVSRTISRYRARYRARGEAPSGDRHHDRSDDGDHDHDRSGDRDQDHDRSGDRPTPLL